MTYEEKLLRYSIQLAMLGQLLHSNLITEKEYFLLKQKLMKDYGIKSDLTSWYEFSELVYY